MKTVSLDGAAIRDQASFHDTFGAAFGFPAFYGRNMDAWVDCMSSLDDPDAHLSSVTVQPGEVVVIEIRNASDFKAQAQDLWTDFLESCAFVNWRRMERGQPALLAVAADP
jgi:RNAse (barnase) inhibitor barstar